MPQTDRTVAVPTRSKVDSGRLRRRNWIVNSTDAGRTREVGGGKEIRTPDIQLAKLALYQLSYTPMSTPTDADSPRLPETKPQCDTFLGSVIRAYSPPKEREARTADQAESHQDGAPVWTRTRDLPLIRRVL
jgi:hypothetical protein